MPLAKRPVSMLTAGGLALALACSGPGAPAGNPPIESARESGSPASCAASAAVSVEAAGSATANSEPSAAPLPSAAAVEAVETARAFGASGALAQKSPMQALNQMVTAQALLVSLLLAPLSKQGAEGPLARVDTPTH